MCIMRHVEPDQPVVKVLCVEQHHQHQGQGMGGGGGGNSLNVPVSHTKLDAMCL